MSSTASQPLTGTRKAAILISLLGEDPAASILRNLPKDDLQAVTDELARLGRVPFDVALAVLEEYQEMVSAQEFTAVGGQELASKLLVKTLGEQAAKGMLERLAPSDEPNTLAMLRRADPQQLAKFLDGERSQTKAMILGQLDSRQASAVLMKMDPDARAECVRRLANLGRYSPAAVAKVSSVLSRKLTSSAQDTSRPADVGFKNVAELMNRMESGAAREILDAIEREEPTLAISIRDLMFTFDDFLSVSEVQIRELMNNIDKKTLMVAIKGASEDLRSLFYRTMSSRAVEMMKEDSEMMGPVRGKDVAKAQQEIVAIARKLESEGKIVLKSEGEDEFVL
jgi:flagellar motor switch protein FliG